MVKLTEAMVKRTNLPVTVKTRLGWDSNSIQIVEVAERLQDVGIKAISIHGRTRVQMYKGEADWVPIAAVKTTQECIFQFLEMAMFLHLRLQNVCVTILVRRRHDWPCKHW